MNQKNVHVSALFQLISLIISSLFLILIFYKPFIGMRLHDQMPHIFPYNSSEKTKTAVQAGLTIHHFMESDIIKNSISIDATVWFAYDPKKVTREQIDQFSFDEATVQRSSPVYFIENGLEIASYDVQVACKMDFDFKEYPLDDHSIWFSLKNNALTVDKYYFEVNQDSFSLSRRAGIKSCTAENKRVQSGVVEQTISLENNTHSLRSSRVIFSLDCNPIDMRHFLNIFLPLFLIFFLTIFSFSFGPLEHKTDIPGIAAASIPALFAYRFVIEAISPNVSYFMMSDYLFLLYLILSLLAFLSVSWALNHSVYIKKIIIIGLYVLMLIGCAIIVYVL